MPDIWVTSDTHFNHSNILTFSDTVGKPVRPFSSVEEMNELMVDNWNRVVKPSDKIYHLGDVFFGAKDDFVKIWSRLNGRKRLIVGNHDDVKYLSQGNFFQKVYMWRIFKDHGITLTHVPIHETSLRDSVINVHGHIHQNKSPTLRHRCVCVEHTNYTPVNLEELNARY